MQYEKELTIAGVKGRVWVYGIDPGVDRANGTFATQKWVSESRSVAKKYGVGAVLSVEMRFDDECKNGHNTFAITGSVVNPQAMRRSEREIAGGCLHEDIAAIFPELAHLIPWHLTSSDSPMHYIANTLYHAGNRDHWGKVKGEPSDWETFIQFGDNPIKHAPGNNWTRGKLLKFIQEHAPLAGGPRYDFEVIGIDHKDRKTFGTKYTFGGFAAEWHECPFESEAEALDFLYALNNCQPKFVKLATAWGEGKERDLNAARSTAIWPEASDEILSSEPAVLKAALEARHADLMARFRADMEAAGFLWQPEAVAA